MAGPNTTCLNAAGCRELGNVLEALDNAVEAGGGTTFAGELVLIDEDGHRSTRLPVYWDAGCWKHRVGVQPGEGI
jgi:hypothetical protein